MNRVALVPSQLRPELRHVGFGRFTRSAMASMVAFSSLTLQAAEFHVASGGIDANLGTAASPFRTIQRAADVAQPGDTITVHTGVYRERVNPPRGGASDAMRIVYQAAPGEKVDIKGSEVVTGWTKVQEDVWKAIVPNTIFGPLNPFGELIHGDWFDPRGRPHHTAAVYLDGDWLVEAAKLDDVMKPVGKEPLWFAKVEGNSTTIWAQFKGVNPNERLVEVNARRAVFYPDQPGRNYITVRGFTLGQAATQWAPPTAEQTAIIGTHWSQGWIIENNTVSHSICSGISLGKHGDQYDNTSADTAEGYVKTIERGLARGWNRDTIGHHIVRNNTVSHCEQAGIVGSLGAAFSTVTGNTIHDVHVRRLFSGAEMAGIKFHAAIDTVISRNHIYRTCLGLWLDWMAQGTRVTGNCFHDNPTDMFVEVDHGPFVVDNNLFLSGTSLLDMSEGGAYAHNLFLGKLISRPEPNRETPYHPAHRTTMAGLTTIKGGDDRFYNNIFVGAGAGSAGKDAAGYGLWVYDERPYPLQTGGNVYYSGAKPYAKEVGATLASGINPEVKLVCESDQDQLRFQFGSDLKRARTELVTTEVLGKAKVPGVAYEAPDGSPLKIDTDYFGQKRDAAKPMPGPFENPGSGPLILKR